MFRRGFKAESERISQEIRSDLGLSTTSLLDIFSFAEGLGIPVVPMSKVPPIGGLDGYLRVFQNGERDSFSALTLFNGTVRLIVHNDSHHPNRRVSNIAHEISHCLLEHDPAPVTNGAGSRYWNKNVEAEADWLGASLLLPREGGLQLALSGFSIAEIAQHFGVSEYLCRWRLNQTGVLRQIERSRIHR
jgi:Zn-dependent peptidase ImmA (M78 family)